MRILLTNDFYPPFIGGAEQQVQSLGQQLARHGHVVGVATVWHADLPEREDDAGVEVYRLRGITTSVPWFYGNSKRRFHPPFPDPWIAWGLRRLVTRFRPDIVHACGWMAYSSAAALMGSEIPLVVSVRDYGYTCPTRTLLRQGMICDGPSLAKCLVCATRTYGAPKAAAAVTGVFVGRTFLRRMTAAVQSISNYVNWTVKRDLINSKPAEMIQTATIHDIISPIFLQNGDSRNQAPDGLPSEPYILFIGALLPHKGILQLLDAYKRLTSAPPLVIIGSVWPDSPRSFPSNVTVLRDIPHSQVVAAWDRCLFGVAPSVWPEPLGNVVFEAMSRGKAVVGTYPGGIADLIVDGETGLLVPSGNVDALTEALRKLIDDSALRERLGAAARERARLFSADVVVPQFEAFYSQILATRRLSGMPTGSDK